ncbi:transmembrane protein 62-like [Mya arenaria]|uniref:transmembrane protein 62-like n=1 Tax=Mya arenaria TaxID=6604 RepID=UPI0022E4623F|nr:transmembrane protein 62-like [Mya arenaria]
MGSVIFLLETLLMLFFSGNVNSNNLNSYFTGDTNNLFWVVQVSDIHISRFYGHSRGPELRTFCDTHLGVIRPDLVMATGDLTDAKFRDLKGSRQYEDEWKAYNETVYHCKRTVKTWLDLRGNHDAFDTEHHDHKNNLFRFYSSQGRANPSSYVYHHKKTFGTYSFIGVDSTPNPGPKRPFNFFGYISEAGEKLIAGLLHSSRSSNMTITFGHYPTSVVATRTGSSIRDMLRNVSVYVCGHLHILGGMARRMYARHSTGLLELELGDWKDNRMYRILAIDHEILSFHDVSMNTWPVVVITSPREASLVPSSDTPPRLASHIRMLIFTTGEVKTVEVHIDGVFKGKATPAGGPVYVLPWKPEDYNYGLHTMAVTVKDILHGTHMMEHHFSLDNSRLSFPFMGRLVLMMDVAVVFKVIFYLVVSVYIVTLLLLNSCQNLEPHLFKGRRGPVGMVTSLYNKWLYCLWLVGKYNKLCYSLVAFIVYVAFGPWFVGELLEGRTGVVFVWGMIVHGSYLPVSLTYVYGLFQLLTFNFPLTIFWGHYLHIQKYPFRQHSLFFKIRNVFIPYCAIVLFQTFIALSEFPSAYGMTAFLLGPVRSGSVIIAVVLFIIVSKGNDRTHSH